MHASGLYCVPIRLASRRSRMGFRGSRVELRRLRASAPLAGLRPSPAATPPDASNPAVPIFVGCADKNREEKNREERVDKDIRSSVYSLLSPFCTDARLTRGGHGLRMAFVFEKLIGSRRRSPSRTRSARYYSGMRDAKRSGRKSLGNSNGNIAAADSPMSEDAKRIVKVFRRGVQDQLAALAKRKVLAIATIDGHTVRAIPKKVGGRFVLVAQAEHTGTAHSKPSPVKRRSH